MATDYELEARLFWRTATDIRTLRRAGPVTPAAGDCFDDVEVILAYTPHNLLADRAREVIAAAAPDEIEALAACASRA